jgi:3-oxoadipate enol-lactonase
MNPSTPSYHGTIRSNGCEIFYELTGSGPALIFAHGLGGNYLSWWQQIPHFSDRFTCVTFSHRGFWPSAEIPVTVGTSEFADDFAMLLDHLRLRDVILIAQSMGGWTCLEYATRFPQNVRGLVLSSTSGAVNARTIVHPDIQALAEWDVRSEEIRKELDREQILAATGKRMALEQPALYYLYRGLNDLTPLSFRNDVRKKIRSERILPPEKVQQLKAPMLFITGDEDIVFPPVAASALAALLPNAEHHQVQGAGHSVYFEKADEFNTIVDSFLDRL